MDRDEHGRFLKGCRPGPGRPRRATEAEYVAATVASCTLEEWTKIVRRAVQDAVGGDHAARSWLASYLIGKPTQRLEVAETGPDELRIDWVVEQLTREELKAIDHAATLAEQAIQNGILSP